MIDRLRGEVVLHYDRGVKRGEVDLVNLPVNSGFRLEDHATFVGGPQFTDVPEPLSRPKIIKSLIELSKLGMRLGLPCGFIGRILAHQRAD